MLNLYPTMGALVQKNSAKVAIFLQMCVLINKKELILPRILYVKVKK